MDAPPLPQRPPLSQTSIWLTTAVLLIVVAGGVYLYARAPRSQPATGTAVVQSYRAFDSGDVDGAISGAQTALSADQNNVPALLALASAYAQKGSLEFQESTYGQLAIATAQRVLAIDAQNSEAWRIIGYAREIMQEYPAAHDAYVRAATLNPQNALALSGNAHAYDLEGDMSKAESGYKAALAVNPNLADAKAGLARVDVYKGDIANALALYVSVAAAPGNSRQRADAAYSAGQLSERTGNYTDAERYLRLATSLDATYAPGWAGLASELFRQAFHSSTATSTRMSLIGDSLADLQKAIRLDQNFSLAHYELAMEMAGLGRFSDATLILKGLKAIIPNDITLSAPTKDAMAKNVNDALSAIAAEQSSSHI